MEKTVIYFQNHVLGIYQVYTLDIHQKDIYLVYTNYIPRFYIPRFYTMGIQNVVVGICYVVHSGDTVNYM